MKAIFGSLIAGRWADHDVRSRTGAGAGSSSSRRVEVYEG